MSRTADPKEQIISWLKEEGAFERVEAHDNARWVVVANHPRGTPLHVKIVAPLSSEDKIILAMGQGFDQEARRLLARLGEEVLREIFLRLRLELNRRASEYTVHEDEQKLPVHIEHQYIIYQDGLTKHEFMQGIREVFKSFFQVQLFLQQELQIHLGVHAYLTDTEH